MKARSLLLAALPASLLALAGCVPEDGFPSLAERPAERDASIEEPARPPVDVPSDADLRARIGALLGLARQGEREFVAALGPAEAAVSRAGAAGSESWVLAQQALSRLEAVRDATTRALADLDQIAIARVGTRTAIEDFAAINAAIAEVERIAVSQQQRWDALRVRLAPLR